MMDSLMHLGKQQRKYGMNKVISRQSSLTSEECFKKTKENLNEQEKVKENERETRNNEYNVMDGVLGCVKV